MILHGYITEKKDLLYENTNIIVRERSIMGDREDHFTVIEKSTYQENTAIQNIMHHAFKIYEADLQNSKKK